MARTPVGFGMTALAGFRFLHPAWLLLLAVVPLALLAWRRSRGSGGGWDGVVDRPLLDALLDRDFDLRATRLAPWLAAIWITATLALAGPAWDRVPLPLYHNQAARVIALELAPSMLAADLRPSRLERARFKIDDILTRSRDEQTALVAYAGDAFVVAPLTDDIGTVRALVPALSPATMPVSGNDMAKAIERSVGLIRQADLHGGEVVVLADGADDAAVVAARAAAEQGVRVSVLGIGTPEGAPVPRANGGFRTGNAGTVEVARLDAAALKAVAAAGGGRYAGWTAGPQDIESLLGATPVRLPETGSAKSDAVTERWRDRGPWLVLLLLPLALACFRRGWLAVLVLALAAPVPRASAASLQDLWQRRDQQAATALAKGDSASAARVAPTPAWRGSAEYRGGDFAAAAKSFAGAPGADGAYNEGNALAKLGKYNDALGAYDRALALEPGMPDARANRDAVVEWLKRHPPPGQQQGADRNGKSGNQKDGQDQSGNDSPRQQHDQDGAPSPADPQGQQGQPSNDEGRQGSNDPQKDSGGKDDPGRSGKSGTDDRQSGSPSAGQQQALSGSIDRNLAASGNAKASGAAQPGGVGEADVKDAERRQALEQMLQRVPDDPGGLLRRKFQLEYQHRKGGGGGDP